MNCPTCNTENPGDALVCSNCGADLPATSDPVTDAGPPIEGQVIPPSVTPPLALQRSEFPGFQVRLAAFMIDFLLVYTAIFLLSHLLNILAAVVWPAYFAILTIMYGQTPGKRALNIGVVDHDGNLPRPRHVMYRELYRFAVVFFAVLVEGPVAVTFIAVALLLMGHMA
ncbi:MAG: RDD family protein, partial [Chloroflexi bacterium]|nr:RDD family protein [Chloroflexota bacterium]